MKALSIQQPWAWLIVNGLKDIENRTWRTAFRGRVLVHAGKTLDASAWSFFRASWRFRDIALPPMESIERGGIVGWVDITDCLAETVELHRASRWFNGPYGFVLANAKPLPFHPLRGKLGFFEVDVGSEPCSR